MHKTFIIFLKSPINTSLLRAKVDKKHSEDFSIPLLQGFLELVP